MNIIEACLAGLVMSCSRWDNDRAVDVVLQGKDGILVLFAGWWEADWGTDGYAYLIGELIQDGETWRQARDDGVLVYFAAPEDAALIQAVRNNRIAQRLSAEAWQDYVSRVKLLSPSEEFTESLAAWMALAAPKPGEDPIAEYQASLVVRRSVGYVRLLDPEGTPTDALVIDELGAAATANGDSGLMSLASQWMAYEPAERPSIAEFLAWVGTRIPYGASTMDKPTEATTDGSVEAIARRYVPHNL